MKLKKLIILCTTILSITVLVACGNSDSSSETDNANNEEDTTTKEENKAQEENADEEDTVSITPEEASKTAEEFLTLVADEEFAQAEALFDDRMASEITAQDLEALWSQLVTDFGEFNGFDYVEEQEIDGYHSFIYESSFGEQPFILNVSINGKNEVGGFYIQ
ncbi:DUF3887 domain-containing protein [Oceanobacillus sp. J11TS1]|uniref:DUF3887 domain-containing protein n=1 Tax=Oceanobacillus sp. J11TS1 TaxID=2807191 RepID=UPI001B0E3E32|nr:DUF3887 domain-containing protein [Oceanobacillus sp. J11TS1]GIO24181.1 hypothetical protein J11TS1_27620 [Oceanobacillus sp. J11TS1]